MSKIESHPFDGTYFFQYENGIDFHFEIEYGEAFIISCHDHGEVSFIDDPDFPFDGDELTYIEKEIARQFAQIESKHSTKH